MNKIQWNSNTNTRLFINENALNNIGIEYLSMIMHTNADDNDNDDADDDDGVTNDKNDDRTAHYKGSLLVNSG